MATNHLKQGDAELMLDVVQEALHDDPGDAVPWALMNGLQRLVPVDVALTFQEYDYRTREHFFCQEIVGGDQQMFSGHGVGEEDDPFWQTYWQSMCSYPQRSGDFRRALHTGDLFPTRQAWFKDPMFQAVPDITTYALILSLPAPPGHARRFVLFSEAREFTDRDRQVYELLRPHLQEIWLDAERRRHGVPALTPREWQVLALAAAGLSYADIAHVLFVSVSTVRKHMEHVRERLGVRSVAAAAAVALPHGPPSARGGVR